MKALKTYTSKDKRGSPINVYSDRVDFPGWYNLKKYVYMYFIKSFDLS